MRLPTSVGYAMACAAAILTLLGASSKPTLPPQGLYNSCEIDTALTMCEARDQQAATAGFKLRVNYIGLLAHVSRSQFPGRSLEDMLAFDATIGLQQIVNVKDEIQDPAGLAGNRLTTSYPVFAKDCGASTNAEVLACLARTADPSPAFWGYYIYDEPGCAEVGIGYCWGSLNPSMDANVTALANYLHKIDPNHPTFGVQTSSGVPACAGGWSGTCAPTQIDNLFGWLPGSWARFTGFDYYPIGSDGQNPADIATIFPMVQSAIARHPRERVAFVAQAFSWQDYDHEDCDPYPACAPQPSTAQIKAQRDQALLASAKAGNPVFAVLYYSQDDVNCLVSPYPGCDADANWKSLTAAAFAPYPVGSPSP